MRKSTIVTAAGALALGSVIAATQVVLADMASEKTTTTTQSTTYSGTVSEVDPSSSTIILRSETAAAPQKYVYTKETVFTDPAGHTVSYDAIKNTPVTVYYTRDGDRMVVSKVVTTKPVTTTETHRESTHTETRGGLE